MQANSMEFPEMYYMHWWAGHPIAILRFTPRKADSGGYLADLNFPFKVMWSIDKESLDFFEKSKRILQFQKRAMFSEKGKLVVALFEQKENFS